MQGLKSKMMNWMCRRAALTKDELSHLVNTLTGAMAK
jgi:hypothetical protein